MSLYAPGFFSAMAGVMPEAGTYGDFQVWLYDGNLNEAFLENQVVSKIDSQMAVPMLSVMHVTELSWLGGRYGFSIMGSYPSVDVGATLTAANQPLRDKDSASGLGDLTLTPLILGWHDSNWHSMFMLNAYLPTGGWDEHDLATTGLNRPALEPLYNLTYLSEETGRELSLAVGYTINFGNEDTDYESGDEFHLDFTLGQWFANHWMAGVAGYWFQQVTADDGAPDVLGSNKGRVLGAGPIVSYVTTLSGGNELLLSARYYHEFGGTNRLEGDALWLRLSFGI